MTQISSRELKIKTELLNLIDNIYIKPIKNVVFVDDEFPTYSDLLTKNIMDAAGDQLRTDDSERYEDDDRFSQLENHPLQVRPAQNHYDPHSNIQALFLSCCEKGIIAYVDNKPNPKPEIIENADLLILDYQLTKDDNPAPCLNILNKLRKTPRFSLVVIYTTNDPQNVCVKLAMALRGSEINEIDSELPTEEFLSQAKIEEQVADYLKDRKSLLDKIETEDARSRFTTHMEAYIKKYLNGIESVELSPDFNISLNSSDAMSWIRSKNMFTVIIQKKHMENIEIDNMLNGLKNALNDYSLTPVTMLTQGCINEIVQQSVTVAEKAFGNNMVNAAMLYYFLSNSEYHTGEGEAKEFLLRCQDIISKIFDSVPMEIARNVKPIAEKISKTTKLIVGDTHNPKNILDIEKVTILDTDINQCIGFNLNKFLCSSKPQYDYITMGTVFRMDGEKNENLKYWLCTSPACDMVPGRKERKNDSNCYRDQLAPINIMNAINLIPKKDISKALKKALGGDYIFISDIDDDGENVDYAFSIKDNDSFRVHTFYCKGGLINSNKFSIFKVLPASDDPHDNDLSIKEYPCHTIAQLRKEYGARILQHIGLHESRVGVNFIKIT